MMPRNLVFVRHGESEGNVANHASRNGDDSYLTPEFRARHTSDWDLTPRGVEQAAAAKEWLDREFPDGFGRCVVSDYRRARHTAGLLGIPNAEWYVDYYLRERDYGDLDAHTHAERLRLFQAVLDRRAAQSFYWRPPNGESMADLCLRFDRALDTFHRECADKDVVVVCHGEVMWAARLRLERLDMADWLRLDASKAPRDRIHNCQILHYTREDPTGEATASDRLGWFRSVCPSDPSLSSNEWQRIVRKKITNEELLESARR